MRLPPAVRLPIPLRYALGAALGLGGAALLYEVVLLGEEPALLLGPLLGFAVAWLIGHDTRRSAIGALTGLALAAPFLISTYGSTQIIVLAIVAIGLNIVTGYAGQISLGHGALVAVGAYTTAILVYDYDWAWWWTLPVSALISVIVGVFIGLPSLRLHGPYLAMATLALAIVLPIAIKSGKTEGFTHGVQGIDLSGLQLARECHREQQSDPGLRCKTKLQDGRPVNYYSVDAVPAPPGFLSGQLDDEEYRYFVCLAFLGVMIFFAYQLLHGRYGRAFIALRDSEVAAQVMGVNLARYKTLAFAVSAFFAGIGGSLFAVSVGFVAPDNFTLIFSLTFLVMIVFGGLETILGGIVGAAIIWELQLRVPDIKINLDSVGFHADFSPQIVYGLVLILIVIFMPYGVVGFFYRLPHSRLSRWAARLIPGSTPLPRAIGGAGVAATAEAGSETVASADQALGQQEPLDAEVRN